jgi:hypothetical protein
MSFYRLSIAKPCTQKWGEMLQEENGNYCLSCQHSVIDFSTLSDKEVISYFTKNINNTTCGRFKKSQLERIQIHIPSYLIETRIPKWQKYLLILFICFGSQIFSVNVVLGNYQTPSVKTETKIPKEHKHKKKKLRIKTETYPKLHFSDFVVDPNTLVFGFVQQAIDPLAIIAPFSYLRTENKLNEQDSINSSTENQLLNKGENSNDGKQKDKTQSKSEFLLPLTTRRRRKGVTT